MMRPHPVIDLIRRRWPWLLTGLLLITLSLVAGVALLSLSGWFITASALAGLGLLLGLDIFTPGAGIRLAAIVRTGSRYAERLVTHEATFRILSDLRVMIFEHLASLSIPEQQALNRGDTLSRFTHDVSELDHFFLGVVGPSVGAIALTLLGAGLMAWVINPILAWPLVALTLLMQPIMAMGVAHQGSDASKNSMGVTTKLKAQLVDTIDGLENILATDQVRERADAIAQLSEELVGQQTKTQYWDALGGSLSIVLNGMTLIATLFIGIGLYERALIDGPWLGLVALFILGTTETWQVIPNAWRRLSETRQAWARVRPKLASSTQIDQSKGSDKEAPRSALSQGTNKDPRVAWIIHNVSFRYPGGSRDVLDRINFTLTAGEKVALVGPSGCGKTTLAYLLMGELAPTSGSIECQLSHANHDDIPAKHQPTIGYLAQEPKLFSDTLGNNLRMAQPAANDDTLISTLALAGLKDWYDMQVQGLETWMDQHATHLSGGEARRLALARLMLQDPEFVILDEPNTGLDQATNASLNTALNAWLADKTALIITHQPEQAPYFERAIRLVE